MNMPPFLRRPLFRPRPLAWAALALVASLTGCMSTEQAPAPVTPVPVPAPKEPVTPTPSAKEDATYFAAQWSDLPGWAADDSAQAWGALQNTCRGIRSRAAMAVWQETCAQIASLGENPSSAAVRDLLQTRLQPWQVRNADGSTTGLVTGYYEPLIKASRAKNSQYRYPIYGVPDDMITVDLAGLYPELKNMRLRGRVQGNRLVPYWSREEIEQGALSAKTLLWAEDPVDLFFMQVQGSGQAQLPDGSRTRLAYADQNGHPYKSIGRWLVDKGELKLEQASMGGIKNWVKTNPKRLDELLNANPSYVFFREEASNGEGPKGALGVPLTAARSIAIDPRSVPLGSPVFLATTAPDGSLLNRLVMAQDTGGAIRGRVRADFYWGFGAQAGAQAGKMRQQGQMWVLWPLGSSPEKALMP